MKVALFTDYPRKGEAVSGGVAAVAVSLAWGLSRIGNMEVHVLTFDRACRSVLVERDKEITVHRLPATRWPQILDIHFGPGRRRLTRYVRQVSPDILHLHETYGLTLHSLPLPHVFTVHGFDRETILVNHGRFARIRSALWGMVERRQLAKHQFIISISSYARHKIESLTSAMIFDIENPIDPRFYHIQREEEKGSILSVGRISEGKNALATIRALAKITAEGVDAKLVVAGANDPPYFQRIVETIRQAGLGDKVQFLGCAGHDQLARELARASILVLPSRQENAPMAIAEAMAAGVPVISSNRCGMPFMIREGETGYLVEPDDVDGIAERMQLLLGDDGLRNAMGRAARREAETRFHPDTVAKRTVEVYRHVVKSVFKGRGRGTSSNLV